MPRYRTYCVALCAIILAGVVVGGATAAGPMQLKSPDIRPNAMIGRQFTFNSFGCTGENRQPRLTWTGVPSRAKALALTMYDPDAPTTVGFVHWVVVRIPPTATSTDALTGAVNALTDVGQPGYVGPCPPVGDKPHRYIFTLWALDTDFPFTERTTYAVFRFTIRGHVLASATLIGRYGR